MILINLLPTEAAVNQKKQRKFRTIQMISTGILLLLIFSATLIVTLRVLQSQNIKKLQTQADASEKEIVAEKDKESNILVLKSRLTTIDQYFGKPSKQTTNYNLISQKILPSIEINTITVDRFGNILLSVVTSDSNAIDRFIEELTSQNAANQFSKVEIESLNRSKDTTYRASLKIVSK